MTVQAPQPSPPQAAFVTFSTDVNPKSTTNLLNIMGNCANQRIPEVHLLISTNGGSIMNGVNVFNVLRAMPFRLITHNVGNVDSIGNVIFLAGTQRYACANTTFMFHGVAFGAQGAFDVNTTKARLKSLMADETRLVHLVTQETTMPLQKVRGLYKHGRTMNATEAHAAGIVHAIQDPTSPSGVPIATVAG